MTLKSSDLQSDSDLDSIRNSCDVFIRPKSNHCLALLSQSLLVVRVDWCDPGLWLLQPFKVMQLLLAFSYITLPNQTRSWSLACLKLIFFLKNTELCCWCRNKTLQKSCQNKSHVDDVGTKAIVSRCQKKWSDKFSRHFRPFYEEFVFIPPKSRFSDWCDLGVRRSMQPLQKSYRLALL